jgi:hypothetical protein
LTEIQCAYNLAAAYGFRGRNGVFSFWGGGELPNISDVDAW